MLTRSSDTFTTAIPCRIIHDSSAVVPSLKIPDLKPFKAALAALKLYQVDSSATADLLDEDSSRPLLDVVQVTLQSFQTEGFPEHDFFSGDQNILRQVSVLARSPLTLMTLKQTRAAALH